MILHETMSINYLNWSPIEQFQTISLEPNDLDILLSAGYVELSNSATIGGFTFSVNESYVFTKKANDLTGINDLGGTVTIETTEGLSDFDKNFSFTDDQDGQDLKNELVNYLTKQLYPDSLYVSLVNIGTQKAPKVVNMISKMLITSKSDHR